MDELKRPTGSTASHLICSSCGLKHRADRLQSVCRRCGDPLLVRYRLDQPPIPDLGEILDRPPGQYRFHEMLPTLAGADTLSLGEGATPLLAAPGLGPSVWVKDEAVNPTGSFKARGMAVAVARNVELGATEFCLPSNGNAGGAAAAYAALFGVRVEVAVPDNTPRPLLDEITGYGATLTLIDGTIADAAQIQAEQARSNGWFSLATLYEPYRIEGKKMMGYEIFWDLGSVPDVVIYPTGGGTGLIGIVKAFEEMKELGWIDKAPRMVAVQVAGCAPIVKAFDSGQERAEPWQNPTETSAYGLRVPSALGDRLMLRGLRETGGTAVAVAEDVMLAATQRLASDAGISGSPEGGACVAAYEVLVASGWITPGETVVLLNTGAAEKYQAG
ncbi:MAG: threonine synthase [Acidimicrobiia bacterium]